MCPMRTYASASRWKLARTRRLPATLANRARIETPGPSRSATACARTESRHSSPFWTCSDAGVGDGAYLDRAALGVVAHALTNARVAQAELTIRKRRMSVSDKGGVYKEAYTGGKPQEAIQQ